MVINIAHKKHNNYKFSETNTRWDTRAVGRTNQKLRARKLTPIDPLPTINRVEDQPHRTFREVAGILEIMDIGASSTFCGLMNLSIWGKTGCWIEM